MIELPIRTCKFDGVEFRAKRHDQSFCREKCRKMYHRRKEIRGARAVELLIAWRVTRGAKKGILGEIAAEVDTWIKEDKANGGL